MSLALAGKLFTTEPPAKLMCVYTHVCVCIYVHTLTHIYIFFFFRFFSIIGYLHPSAPGTVPVHSRHWTQVDWVGVPPGVDQEEGSVLHSLQAAGAAPALGQERLPAV